MKRYLLTAIAISWFALSVTLFAITFVTDTFTGSADTQLGSHTGEAGATWTIHANSGGTLALSNTNGLTIWDEDQINFYYSSGTPAGTEYDVTADVKYISGDISGTAIGVTGRMDTSANTRYIAVYNGNATQWELVKVVAGSSNILGTFSQGLSSSTTYGMRLEIKNATKKLFIDGVERISTADDEITAAGRAGVIGSVNSSTSPWPNGLHLDNFNAIDIAGGGGGSTAPPRLLLLGTGGQ